MAGKKISELDAATTLEETALLVIVDADGVTKNIPVSELIALLPAGPPGEDGEDGGDGAPGAPGAAGDSAYEIAVANGFVGDVSAWLDSLRGEQGPPGEDGGGGGPLPHPATTLAAEPGDGEVALAWIAPTDPPTPSKYRVYRAAAATMAAATMIAEPTSASYTDDTAVNGTTYYYAVASVSSGGAESYLSSVVSATPEAAGGGGGGGADCPSAVSIGSGPITTPVTLVADTWYSWVATASTAYRFNYSGGGEIRCWQDCPPADHINTFYDGSVSGFSSGVTYRFKALSVDAVGLTITEL